MTLDYWKLVVSSAWRDTLEVLGWPNKAALWLVVFALTWFITHKWRGEVEEKKYLKDTFWALLITALAFLIVFLAYIFVVVPAKINRQQASIIVSQEKEENICANYPLKSSLMTLVSMLRARADEWSHGPMTSGWSRDQWNSVVTEYGEEIVKARKDLLHRGLRSPRLNNLTSEDSFDLKKQPAKSPDDLRAIAEDIENLAKQLHE